MKRTSNPGLQYIQELGIRQARNSQQLYLSMLRELGAETADKLASFFEDRAGGKYEENGRTFYECKNADDKASILVSGLFDSDIYRQACNWVYEHRECFGRRILDIGCDNGIMTCFLARSFPGSQVVGLDRYPSGTEVARRLAAKMGLGNVSFLVCDTLGYKNESPFDTVFSMRTMHENVEKDGYPQYGTIYEKCAFYSGKLGSYAKSIASVLGDNGSFISIERVERNPLLLGWINALNNEGLGPASKEITEIRADEAGDTSFFQAARFQKGARLTYDEIYKLWSVSVCGRIDLHAPEYTSWEAEVMFHNSKDKLIKGIEVRGKDNHLAALMSLWTCKSGSESPVAEKRTWIQADDTVLLYSNDTNGPHVWVYESSLTDELTGQIERAKQNNEKEGWAVTDVL